MNDNTSRSCASILGASYHGTTFCAAASRISTTNGSAISIFEKSLDNPNNEKLIKAVLSSGHRSVMEHCFFNLAFNNVSVFVEQYIIEFRLASFTVQSRRYVDFSTVKFFESESFSSELHSLYSANMQSLIDTYGQLLALDVPKEDARFVLPYCFHSNFYCSCNARELLHMICTMIYGRGSAFEEIRTLGLSLAEEFEKYFPGQIKSFENKYTSERERAYTWLRSLEGKDCNDPDLARASVELVSGSTVTEAEILSSAAFNFAPPCDESGFKYGEEPSMYDQAQLDADSYSLLFSSRSRELELINLGFKLRDISLSSLTHLVRHRIQSVLVPCISNALYTNRYVMPDSVKNNPEALEIYTRAFKSNTEAFRKALSLGLSPEYAVYFTLSGNVLSVIASMNGRELVHFLQLRTCNRAQWEIRSFAIDMLKLSRTSYPTIFSRLGPTCYMKGACPEGKKTCGEMAQVKEFFKDI